MIRKKIYNSCSDTSNTNSSGTGNITLLHLTLKLAIFNMAESEQPAFPILEGPFPDMLSISYLANFYAHPDLDSTVGFFDDNGLSSYPKCCDFSRMYNWSMKKTNYTSHLLLSSSYVAALTFSVSPEHKERTISVNNSINLTTDDMMPGVSYLPIRSVTELIKSYSQQIPSTKFTRAYTYFTELPLSYTPNPYLSLSKRLSIDYSSDFRDVAAITRIALLSRALDIECAQEDITPSMFLRNISIEKPSVSIYYPAERAVEIHLIAMTFNNFVDFINRNHNEYLHVPKIFEASKMDVTWVGIPVSRDVISENFMPLYIACFLSSTLSWGTVNHVRKAATTPGCSIQTAIHTVPAANTAFIEGKLSAILIILENESRGNSIKVAGCEIPVYHKQSSTDLQPPDFWPHWHSYYTESKPLLLQEHCQKVWNYLNKHLATVNSAGMALYLTSELSLAIRPGMRMTPSNETSVGIDRTCPLLGGIQLVDENGPDSVPLCPKSQFLIFTRKWPAPAGDVKRHMQGFNNAAVSSLHVPPSGFANTSHFENMTYVTDKFPASNNCCYVYSAQCASTLKRLGVATGLIAKETNDPYIFPSHIFSSPRSMAARIHMWSHALAATTSVMLLLNNVSFNDWAGYNDDLNIVTNNHKRYIAKIKNMATNGMVIHFLRNEYESFTLYDKTDLLTYYGGVDINKSGAWDSFSPVPVILTKQWINRLKLPINPDLKPTFESVPVNSYWSFLLDALLTFDGTNPLPLVITTSDYPLIYRVWVDQYSYLTTIYAGQQCSEPEILSTTTLLAQHLVEFEFITHYQKIYHINNGDNNTRKINILKEPNMPYCSEIRHPDKAGFQYIAFPK